MAGCLVLVVGPSGAGKDTLIAAAKAALRGNPRVVFPRRIITRSAVAALEDHESVSVEQFARMRAAGAFALDWQAHGLSYGLPATLLTDLRDGRIVVVNGSRAMVAEAGRRFAELRVLLIEAAPRGWPAAGGKPPRRSGAGSPARWQRRCPAPSASTIPVRWPRPPRRFSRRSGFPGRREPFAAPRRFVPEMRPLEGTG